MTCSVEEVHLYDIGTIIDVPLLDCDLPAEDIDSATVKQILFKKPSGAVVTKDAIFKTDGTDGILRYVTITDDIDEVGTWKIQARVTLPSGTWSSSIDKFKVYTNLDA